MSGHHFSGMKVRRCYQWSVYSLSLIIIPTPNNCLHFNQETSQMWQMCPCYSTSLWKAMLCYLQLLKTKNDSTKKMIWLNYLVEITFKTSEPVNCKWDLNHPGRRPLPSLSKESQFAAMEKARSKVHRPVQEICLADNSAIVGEGATLLM